MAELKIRQVVRVPDVAGQPLREGRLALVRAQIIENDDVAAGQGRRQELLDISGE